MFDLAELNTAKACEDGAEIELLHPVTKEPLGQFILVVGKHSKTFTDYVARDANEERRKAAQRRGKENIKTFEEVQAEGIELLVACTKGFRCYSWLDDEGGDFLHFGGKFEFSKDNAKKLYREFPWIKEQIDAGIVDLGNFIKS
jgi:hypothetical protein